MAETLFPADVAAQAAAVLAQCRSKGWRIATVESCTGGLISAALTEIPGSSDVLAGSLVTYANSAKMGLVGVSAETLKRVGAVSAETADEMARGALRALPEIALSLSVTGVAGPGGGSVEKPVGLVYMATALRGRLGASDQVTVERNVFCTDLPRPKAISMDGPDALRTAIRLATLRRGLALLMQAAKMH
ncbi:MAG: hypothetical protein RL291_540 [Pseudomonadota bacterium]|jgi:nicotinamide-nucleotide amidase